MAKYRVNHSFSGYCRGHASVVVEADSEEEAREQADRFSMEEEIVRDDRDFEFDSVEKLN